MKYLHPLSDRITIAKPGPKKTGLQNMGGILVDAEFTVEQDGYRAMPALAVGPGCTTVKPGDVIVFFTDVVHPVKVGDDEFWFVHEAQVQGVLKDDGVPAPLPLPVETPPADWKPGIDQVNREMGAGTTGQGMPAKYGDQSHLGAEAGATATAGL